MIYFRSRPVLDIFTSVSGELENIDPDKQGCEMDRTASTVWYVLSKYLHLLKI